jgi:hypothetical protein
MKKLIILQLLLFVLSIKAQQTAPLKEAFDDYLEKRYTTGVYDYSVAANRPNCWLGWGHILSAYLNMYKATGDKAYLNKFAKHATAILSYKGQNSPYPFFWDFTNFPTATDPATREIMSFHYTGRMIKPMAEFVYLVKQVYPALQSTPILASLGLPFANYGDFANYIQGQVEGTLDYITTGSPTYYRNDNVGFSKTQFTYTYCEINQQADWGSTLLYAGKLNTSKPQYTTKGIAINNILRHELSFYGPNSSYTWFHNGAYNLREDVSHGATDLSLVFTAYLLYGSGLWTTDELKYFAHTFTFNIWDRTNERFTNNVFGMISGNDNQITTCNFNINNTPNFWGPGEILTWMPIYQWDDANAGSNGVYKLLLNQCVNLMAQTNPLVPVGYCPNSFTCNLCGAQSLEGFTEIVRAQWREECFNLTLRNRDVRYDQDFNVKNKLIVDPYSQGAYCSSTSQNYPNSFADPVISTNKFIVQNNTTVNMIAGENITLMPGFETMTGAKYTASISSNNCTGDGLRLITQEEEEQIIRQDLNSTTTSLEDIEIYPNPSAGKFTLLLSEKDNKRANKQESIKEKEETVTVYIYNLIGKLIYSQQNIPSSQAELQINIEDQNKGMYLLRIINKAGQSKTGKIIIN